MSDTGGDCRADWLAMTRGEGLPRRLARNDGKIIVVARSEAIAERRGNLAKSLSDGREGLPRRLSRNDEKIVVVARSKASAERRGDERVL